MMCESKFTLYHDAAAADPPHIGDGVMAGATRPGRDQGRAAAGEAGDAVDTRGFNGLGQGHGRQNRGEPPGQHRLARPRWAEQQDIMTACKLSLCYHIEGKIVPTLV
jgi:hypothetical protein